MNHKTANFDEDYASFIANFRTSNYIQIVKNILYNRIIMQIV